MSGYVYVYESGEQGTPTPSYMDWTVEYLEKTRLERQDNIN